MRRRRKTDGIAESVIVKTEDGKTFRCSIVSTGEGEEPHWVLMDEHAEQFLGPPVIPEPAPERSTNKSANGGRAKTRRSV